MSGLASNLTIDDISVWLLENKFLLTGLELYQESAEKGSCPKKLEEFYSPDKIESYVKTEDMSDWTASLLRGPRGNTKLSEPIPDSDTLINKISTLEYNLRQERYNSQVLRKELSQVLKERKEFQNLPENSSNETNRPITFTETRILNYLIHKHLLQYGYKLSAVSLASEVGDPIDNWRYLTSIYGLDSPEPPSILHIFRTFYGFNSDSTNEPIYELYEKIVKENITLINSLNDKCEALTNARNKIESLEKQLRDSKLDKEKLKEKEIENDSSKSLTEETSSEEQEDSRPDLNKITRMYDKTKVTPIKNDAYNLYKETIELSKKKMLKKEKSLVKSFITSRQEHINNTIKSRDRDFNFLFQRDEWNTDEIYRRITSEIEGIKKLEQTNESIPLILSKTLPNILRGVILSKRHELIPLIVASIAWTTDYNARYELIHTLFNIIIIPDEKQRKVIIDGFIYLSELAGEDRTSSEILPHFAEQSSSQHEERRILAAELCGWLAPYVKPDMRLSFLLSIIQQLALDKSSSVRTSAATNLARLLVLEEKQNDTDSKKFQQIADTVLQLLNDPDNHTANASQVTLLPSFGDFAERLELLQQKFLPDVCNNILQIIIRTNGKNVTAKDISEIDKYAQALVYFSPMLFESALLQDSHTSKLLRSLNNEPKKVVGKRYLKISSAFSKESKALLKEEFNKYINQYKPEQKPQQKWSIVDWIEFDFVPKIVEITLKAKSSVPAVVDAICSILCAYTEDFGPQFSKHIVSTKFTNEIEKLQKLISTKGPESPTAKRCSRVVIIYIVGVLSSMGQEELSSYLSNLILDISQGRNGYSPSYYYTIDSAISYFLHHFPERKEDLISVARNLIGHNDVQVRHTITKFYYSLIKFMSTNEFQTKIIPALIILSNDSDITVRCNVMEIFGELLTTTQDQTTIEKITDQVSLFIDQSPKPKLILQIAKTFRNIITNVPESIRDDFILKKMIDIANFAVNDVDVNRQKELADELFETYKSLNGTLMSKETIRTHFLPGLKILHKYNDLISQEKRNILLKMVTEMDNLVATKNVVDKKDGIGGFFKW